MFELKPRLHLSVSLLAVLMILLTITAFSPGAMSDDSSSLLFQAITGSFDDTHSPLMAAFWRFLLFFTWYNPAVLFFAHAILYWWFWTILAIVAFEEWNKQVLVLAVAALPPLWSQIIVLWADSELSLFLLGAYVFGILASLYALKKGEENNMSKFIFLAISVSLFIYASAVRKNSLPALVPLAFFMARAAFEKISKARAVAFACCLCAFSFIAADFINYGCLKAKKKHVFQVMETFDIVGVFSQTKRVDLLPDYWKTLNHQLTPEMLLEAYTPYSEVPLSFWGKSPVLMTSDPSQLRELNQKWLRAFFLFPAEFLHHRWEVFKRLMGIGEAKIFFALFFEITKEQFFYVENNGDPRAIVKKHFFYIEHNNDPQLQKSLKSYFVFFRNTILFRGWFYLCSLLTMLAYQWFKLPNTSRLKLPAICSALSAFLYGIGYFAYGPSAEFRFLYPMVALFFASLVLTVSARQTEHLKRPKAISTRPSKRARYPKLYVM